MMTLKHFELYISMLNTEKMITDLLSNISSEEFIKNIYLKKNLNIEDVNNIYNKIIKYRINLHIIEKNYNYINNNYLLWDKLKNLK